MIQLLILIKFKTKTIELNKKLSYWNFQKHWLHLIIFSHPISHTKYYLIHLEQVWPFNLGQSDSDEK